MVPVPFKISPELKSSFFLGVLGLDTRSWLAWFSLTMDTETEGAAMWTFKTPPTRSRTVAVNLVLVFITCGGCFSMMKVPVTRLVSASVIRSSNCLRSLLVCPAIIFSKRFCSCFTCCFKFQTSHIIIETVACQLLLTFPLDQFAFKHYVLNFAVGGKNAFVGCSQVHSLIV